MPWSDRAPSTSSIFLRKKYIDCFVNKICLEKRANQWDRYNFLRFKSGETDGHVITYTPLL